MILREAQGDAWELSRNNGILCLTTNSIVTNAGACVMGAGIALEAKKRFPHLPHALGARIQASGNHVYDLGAWGQEAYDATWRIVSYPVKDHWKDTASSYLIERSMRELDDLLRNLHWEDRPVYLPRPGCGNGKRTWEGDVEPLLQRVTRRQSIIFVCK